MSFATGFNTGGSSAFPLAIVNDNGSGASDVAHDPRANRGGAGGILKATTLLTRNAGRTVQLYNSLPDQWYGTENNTPATSTINGPGALYNRFQGSVSLAAGGSDVIALYAMPLQAQTAAATALTRTIMPTIPWTYLQFISGAAGVGGWALDPAKVRFQYCATTVGGTTSKYNTLPVGTITVAFKTQLGGGTGPLGPGLAISAAGATGGVTIDWTLDLLPPSLWGAGFIGTDGSVATAAANFLNI